MEMKSTQGQLAAMTPSDWVSWSARTDAPLSESHMVTSRLAAAGKRDDTALILHRELRYF